jgi:hypothetical protein
VTLKTIGVPIFAVPKAVVRAEDNAVGFCVVHVTVTASADAVAESTPNKIKPKHDATANARTENQPIDATPETHKYAGQS